MLSSIKPKNIDQSRDPKFPELSEKYSVQTKYNGKRKSSPLDKIQTPKNLDKSKNQETNELIQGSRIANFLSSKDLQVFDVDSDANDIKNRLKTMNIVNIGLVKCPENKEVIMVYHDKKNKKFTFFDQSNSPIGYFTIDQLIKYIGKLQYPDFMSGVDINVSADIIETFIVKGATDDYGYDIQLVSHMSSPFMGNIEMLMKLNNDIKDFENNDMGLYLEKVGDKKIERKVNQCIKEFIYILLGHILKIISTVSEHIKSDGSRQNIKESLLRYSCGITYRITNYVLDQLDIQNEYINGLQGNLHNMVIIKKALNEKINHLSDSVESQNRRVSSLSDKLDTILLNNTGIISRELANKSKNQNGGDNVDPNFNGSIQNTTDNYDKDDIMGDLEQSPTSNIIEEIFNTTTTKKSLDVPDIFDSENGYNSDSADGDSKAFDYISDDDNSKNSQKNQKGNSKLDTDDESEMGAIYNI